ncbi:hypothetical protein CWB96_00110 [Pseudoalteromonas citrea]|uniref:Uncharacterized protein n=1 Tax=Pseudoalteromonas citrea TaxID=43655 RepID=A0A5S3XX00_9GAMM|nr:hypothetical protein [Pseudoalteromonas citrea]TMP46269.1 hypothetical protein CWB97_02105 [Pseudoalteromonas citrea]TMP63045.1 hypothetical protein CWB96_00110 [Pseudoalteromonas citrea]
MSTPLSSAELFNSSTVQSMLHGWGSPVFVHPESTNHGSMRRIYLHGFVGRMPTEAEVFYGTFAWAVDDLEIDQTMTPPSLATAHLGYVCLSADGSESTGQSAFGKSVLANGRILPEGAAIVSAAATSGDKRLLPIANADQSWMLDFTFASDKEFHWVGGNRAHLQLLKESNKLTHNGAPTWFMLSDSAQLPTISQNIEVCEPHHEVMNPGGLKKTGRIEEVTMLTHAESCPYVFGTIGTTDSNADLQLHSGFDSLNSFVPSYLRIIVK